MIAYLEGRVIKQETDRIVLLCGAVGYEVLLPKVVMDTLKPHMNDETISLFIYHYQTERQPKPTLIGFNLEIERDFFRQFITVEAIGPLKAIHALSISVREIAIAIENKDVKGLSKLKGIGNRTAQKIVATLHGKMKKYALMHQSENQKLPSEQISASMDEIKLQVTDVLINQLGHRPVEAEEMIEKALKRSPSIDSAEALFDEVYRGEMAQ
ncbi:MAG: holliday junction DNA helicase RuvA [Candidatus Magnetoglobus multicellularis str. Araruama]|uniref:Holliday junction branch migration complex subunit RuvA n=1 Tax=Candidatus Magnetoglobus multicellularis str. Araruama TaxID=890399 RepID=A0A1V1PDI3_9BACT|nr:MAG: holliday junction DNA helicase RuvA [Candidatus Magnetoglobus multicellularis str. Araruama]